MRCLLSGVSHDNYQARWFEHCEDRVSGEQVHIYKGGYWETKDRGTWEGCPDIFWTCINMERLLHHTYLPPLYTPNPPNLTLCSKRSPDHSLLGWRRREGAGFLPPTGWGRTGIKLQGGLVPVWAQKREELTAWVFQISSLFMSVLQWRYLYDTYSLCSKKTLKKWDNIYM